MTTETALPTDAPNIEAGETAEQTTATLDPSTEQTEAKEGDEQKTEKKEKTAEQREIDRLRRRVDNLTRQKYELKAHVPQQASQQNASDDEPVTLSRAELQKYIAEQAKQLAPAMTEQQAEIERRTKVVQSLAKELGQEKFDELSEELDNVFGGLTDRSGAPKAATDAIFYADDPKAVIEYLTDPDNAEEAERIASMSPIQAGKAIAKLESKMEAAKSTAKPKASNAPRPLEPVRSGGTPKGMPDPSDTKAYIAWANAQERAQR